MKTVCAPDRLKAACLVALMTSALVGLSACSSSPSAAGAQATEGGAPHDGGGPAASGPVLTLKGGRR
ncbi:MAG: hypothetical protein JOZ69_06055 [Myxococcales bacterium]|nr:hypothetical protein [Myxococcales bacterium]